RQDFKEAAKWFRKAAEQGYAAAQTNLGGMYYSGEGVRQDFKEAAKWLMKAAVQGNPSSQALLGLMYTIGKGVSQDVLLAYAWSNLAAASGDETAKALRDEIAINMTPDQMNKAQQLSQKIAATITSNKTAQPKGNGNTPKGNGTGFFITNDGYILTNNHVVEDAQKVEVVVGIGKRLKARIVKRDPSNDLAVLKVDGQFSSLPVASSRGVGLGTDVFTVGFPQVILQGFSQKLTKGSISGLSGIQDDPLNFQISVPTHSGNSGGALVDSGTGNVIGVIVAKLRGAETQLVNYAVKGTFVNGLLESLPSIATHLKEPHPKSRKRDFATIAKEVQNATVMVLVY
ncbi:MAG: trypsin-like serine protease, partial [Opitutae bacterium]|nr:trypsin-like serine protease [Opitutae bacterium]